MGRLQKLILACVPDAWAESMERESRGWKLVCPCGCVRSIWEIGGIRWKAAGEPRWHRTTWRPEG
jgi:hypothetical protein